MTGRPPGRALLLATLIVACSRPVRDSRPPLPTTADIGAEEMMTVSGPGAASYATTHPPRRARAPLEPTRKMMLEALTRAAAVAGIAPLDHDRRLDDAADDMARGARRGEMPPQELISFATAHQGLVDPETSVFLMRAAAGPGAEEAMIRGVTPDLPKVVTSGPWRRVGVGIDRGRTEVIMVVALQQRQIALLPVPRTIGLRQTVELRGRFLVPASAPLMLITPPRGEVRTMALPTDASGFVGRVTCDAGRGTYQVEIAATLSGGPAPVANFPVYCDVKPPRSVRVLAHEGVVSRRQDPETAERELFALINRDRAAAGLPPVVLDRRVSNVARAHSREMAATDRPTHMSPTTGSAVQRLARAGLSAVSVVRENIARAYSATEAERGLMGSPGHRANILARDVTHVGIGIAAGRPDGGIIPLFVTQLFVAYP